MYHLLTFLQQNGNELDEETFCHEVVDVKEMLKEGPLYYKPAKQQDQEIEADIKTLNLQPEVQSFMCKLSAYLNLDAHVAHSMFLEFLASNPDLDSENLKHELAASSGVCGLLPQLRQFYFTERLCMLRLYKVAFADVASPPWSALAELLQPVVMELADRDYKDILEMLMKFYKLLPDSGQRLSSKYFPFLDDEEDARQWREQRLQEAEETLQAIFLLVNSAAFADKLAANADALSGMVEALLAERLAGPPAGLLLENVADTDSDAADSDVRCRRVGFLQCLIVLAALDPAEACRQLSEDASESAAAVGSASPLPVFDRVSELLRSQLPGDRRNQAPVLLMCAVVLGSRGDADGAAVQLADKAIRRLTVFDYLAGCLGPDVQVIMGVGVGVDATDFACSSALLQLYNCLAMDLLALVSAYAALDSLGEQHKSAYLSLFASLLPSVCACGQQQQHQQKRRFSLRSLSPVLERMCSEFPATLAIFHVCSQLAGMATPDDEISGGDGDGESEEADDLVCDLVSCLGAFSERIADLGDNPSDYLRLLGDNDDQQQGGGGGGVVSTCERRPLGGCGGGGPVIPAGCQGEIVGDEYITWQLPEPYSVWPVIEHELAVRSRQPLQQLGASQVNRLAGLLADARTWLVKQKFRAEALRLADHAVCMLVRQPAGLQRHPALLAGCVSFLAACLPLDGQRLARQLERCGALPLIRSPYELDKPNSYQLESSLICTVHDNQECTIGQYPVLSAYLDFLVSLAVSQLPDLSDLLLSGIVYVARALLPNFQRWRYQDPMDSVRIASKCLLFLHEVLNASAAAAAAAATDNSASRDGDSPAVYQSVCLRMLRSSLVAPVISQLATIPVAKLILESDMSTYGLTTDSLPLARTVWLALSPLNRLIPTVEQQQQQQWDLLSNLGIDPDRITQSLLTYTWYYSTPRVTKMALIVLKKLVKFSRTSNLTLADGCSKRLVRSLLDRLASATESEEVRALLFDFLSESVLCGKTSLLNDLVSVQRDTAAATAAVAATSESSSSAAKPSADCCLTVALNLLNSADTISPLLLSSVVQLLSSLWLQNCTILTRRIRNSGTFWTGLQSVLCAEPVLNPADDPLCCQAVTWAHALGLLGIELLMQHGSAAGDGLQATLRKLLCDPDCRLVRMLDCLRRLVEAADDDADAAAAADTDEAAGANGLATRQRCLHQLACGIRTLLTIVSYCGADSSQPRPNWRQLRACLSSALAVRSLPAVTRSRLAAALLAAVNSDLSTVADSPDRLCNEIRACSTALALSLGASCQLSIIADLLAVLARSVESAVRANADIDADKLASLACRCLDYQPQLSLALLGALISLGSSPVSVVDILPLLTLEDQLPIGSSSFADAAEGQDAAEPQACLRLRSALVYLLRLATECLGNQQFCCSNDLLDNADSVLSAFVGTASDIGRRVQLELTAHASATPAPPPPSQLLPASSSANSTSAPPPNTPSLPLHWTSTLTWQLRLADCLLRLVGEAGLERCVALAVCYAELLCRLLAMAAVPATATAAGPPPTPAPIFDAALAASNFLFALFGHPGLLALHSPAWLQPALMAALGSAINCLVRRLSDAKSAVGSTPATAIDNDGRLLLACLHAVRRLCPPISNLAALPLEEVASMVPVTQLNVQMSNSGLSLGSLLAVCRLPRSLPGQAERKSVAARLLVSECLLHLHRLPEQRQRRILCRDMRSELAGILGLGQALGRESSLAGGTRRSVSVLAGAPSTPTPEMPPPPPSTTSTTSASASPLLGTVASEEAEENAAAVFSALGAYFNSLA